MLVCVCEKQLHSHGFSLPFAVVFQPLRCQLVQFSENARKDRAIGNKSTSQGSFKAFRADMAAISSMRLFVVIFSPPEISFLNCPYMRTAPQPPGPGLPLHAPSVYITTFFNASSLKIKLTLSPYRCYNHQGFTPKGHGVMVTRWSPKTLLRVRVFCPCQSPRLLSEEIFYLLS